MVTEIQRERLQEIELEDALRVLVLGEFSGGPTLSRKPLRVDRDNFDQVLKRLGVHIELGLGDGQLDDSDLKFASLADFEPDSIFRRSDLFRDLNAEGEPYLYSEPEEAGTSVPRAPSPEELSRLASPGGLLDAIVENTADDDDAAALAGKRSDEWQAVVDRIVKPYAIPGESPGSQRVASERMRRISRLMGNILHDPRFQALEAAWRGLDLLVRHLDSDRRVHIYIVDLPKEMLATDLELVVNFGVAGEPWDLVAGNYAFDRCVPQDLQLLERIALASEAAGVPFIAECLPSHTENAKALEVWEALRRSPQAAWVALALPRFLLRLPYGKETCPIESFDFEEMPGEPAHGDYLWGNPAFACAFVIGKVFLESGRGVRSPVNQRLAGLPVHVFTTADGDTETKACAEVFLSDRDCATLLAQGLVPLASVKGTDTISVPRIQSIANPAHELGH